MTKDLEESAPQGQRPVLDWTDGVPVARQFSDPYYSLENGLAETRYVFLQGNDLPARFRIGFHIAELGFGTGLSCLTAWQAWRQAGLDAPLSFTSFEAFPMAVEDMRAALSPFEELYELTDRLLEGLAKNPLGFVDDSLHLTIVPGDARTTVPDWSGKADAWFLDGFAPARNPELWEAELLAAVGDHTAKGGTAATYTAAGAVRRALSEAGFEVTRVPGYGRKRHMTKARLP